MSDDTVKMGDFTFYPSTPDCRCPCGGTAQFGRIDSADGTPIGTHSTPVCKDFEQRELIDYMRFIRFTVGGPQA